MTGEKKLPHHVALIMDGNRRWAQARGLSRKSGHQAGIDALREIIRTASNIGIKHLSVYGFSLDNWHRSQDEVNDLMLMVRNYIKSDLDELHQHKVRLTFLGKREGVDEDILNLIDHARHLTRHNEGMVLTIAFNYGARDEIARVAQALAQAREEITLERLDAALAPAVDLLIRTGGEQRLSDFLLWQNAYAEFIFVDSFWPDFSPALFLETLDTYQSRRRRFGADEALLEDE